MIIKDMFKEDIDRNINGVVQVDESDEEEVYQEVKEYIITNELRKHFVTFFDKYSDSFDTPTSNTGVWISGFFGSGKSHFLKMLSYILENRDVHGKPTVEWFRDKFQDDPGTFMLIDKATAGETDTILFDIDTEASIHKDKTAVLRVFAKMFYKYLGFHGEDLKVAKLEQFVDKQGKTEEFRKVFEEKNGSPWVSEREAYAFWEDDIVATLMQVLGMSETAARNWFNGTDQVETSIAQLVSEIKAYVDTKPENFRLLFMIDEMGQYVGESLDMLLNLQSLVEELGSKCRGKVWVVCTGQEAIDDVINLKNREDEFSRIQARFNTRLSLSSSSADEVIEKRILDKNDNAKQALARIYSANDAAMKNLFTFSDAAKQDLTGFSGEEQFINDYPFVPYQFKLIQDIFNQVRRHGNAGKSISSGERSMLSGFQESAQKIEDKDEYALAPLYLFYNTVQTFLEDAIRRVINRADRAAQNGEGLEAIDVEVLKLLYLIRYIDDDIPATVDNIVVLMADDIRMDKIAKKTEVQDSLNRLHRQNYIALVGNTYQFLTDEEQDVQIDIRNTSVPQPEIINRLAQIIFGDIYPNKKYRYGDYDFAFDAMVDSMNVGTPSNNMVLQLLTMATDDTLRERMALLASSKGRAIISLQDGPYYNLVEMALQIRNYVKHTSVQKKSPSMQAIIREQQDQADLYEKAAAEELSKAILQGEYYVDGEQLRIPVGPAVNKINVTLEWLVKGVYSSINLVEQHAESDENILHVLDNGPRDITGINPNSAAAEKINEYLDMQYEKNVPITMADIQTRYQGIPYGWKEIDIAFVVAGLIYDQKVTIKYAGNTIQPGDRRLPDMLRKKSEIGKVSISKRITVPVQKINTVTEFMREYFNIMDVPSDEDGLVAKITEKFTEEEQNLNMLLNNYSGKNYPDRDKVNDASREVRNVIAKSKDNIALIDYIIQNQGALLDSKEDVQRVKDFFKSQVSTFDKTVNYMSTIRDDRSYLEDDEQVSDAMNKIRLITSVTPGLPFNYNKIPELNSLVDIVKTYHDSLLEKKREDLNGIATECVAEIRKEAGDDPHITSQIDSYNDYFDSKKRYISEAETLTTLDGFSAQMWARKDQAVSDIQTIKERNTQPPAGEEPAEPEPKKVIKTVHRQAYFPMRTITSEEELDKYLESVRKALLQQLKDCDGIKIN